MTLLPAFLVCSCRCARSFSRGKTFFGSAPHSTSAIRFLIARSTSPRRCDRWRSFHQDASIDRHLAQALAGCGKNRVGNCAHYGRSSSLRRRLHNCETHKLILFVVRESESCQEFGVHVICRLTEASTSDPNRIQPRSGVMLRFLDDADVHVKAVATEWRRH